LLDNLTPSPAVQAELRQALTDLCPNGELVAVRSSAHDEDGAQHSFAGQLDSFLFVLPQEVAGKIAAVWRSGFSERSLTYRREQGLSLTPRAPAVLIQRMVNAEVSGAAFSVDPVTGRRDVAVIGALYGLGTALVSGQADADTYHVDRQGQIISRNIAIKRIAHIYRNGNSEKPKEAQSETEFPPVSRDSSDSPGLQTVTLPHSQANQPALTDFQIKLVADLARRTEEFFDRPQDIEWAIEGEQLYLLQSRPITGLPNEFQIPKVGQTNLPETFEVSRLPQANDVLNVWDNSNIAESYPGVTTPLTFSFARRAYEEVYRQFCRMMGVPTRQIANHSATFRRMLGLMQGRIYYNLLSWYQVLALLPGYKINRRFMEQMMGVKESPPDELLNQYISSTRASRLLDGVFLLRSIVGLIANYLLLPGRINKFYIRLNQALGTGRPDLSRLRADELAAYYRNLEQQLLTRWDAPLVNDFFAMIFYGLLRKLTEKWCGDSHGTLQNALLTGTGGIISAEPVMWIPKF
jgi:pyruvate,water dikinase